MGIDAWSDHRRLEIDSKKRARERLRNANFDPRTPKIVIDLSYEQQRPGELYSLAKQVQCSYHTLLTSAEPVGLILAPFSGEIVELLSSLGAERWGAEKVDGDVSTLFQSPPQTETAAFALDPADVVYLSPDADNVLTCVEDGKVYVVGGIVDKTVTPK